MGVGLGLSGSTRLARGVDLHEKYWEVSEKAWDLSGILHVDFDSAVEGRCMFVLSVKQEATAVEQVLHLSHVSSKSHELVKIMIVS